MMMKKYINKILLIVFSLLLVNTAFPQKWYGIVNYQMSAPLGDTKEFTDEFSFRGFGFEFRKALSRDLTAGISLGWNVFYQRTDELIELNTENPGAVYGVQDRYINAFPIMLNFHKYFGGGKGSIFFVGLNAGGSYTLQRIAIGIYEFDNNEWQWGAAPEIGVTIPMKGNSTLVINGKYHYYFTGELANGMDVNHQYVSIGIGFAWRQY
jgi:hypothetical protein